MTESDLPVVDFHPYRWGDPAHPAELPPAARDALQALGVKTPSRPPVEPAKVNVPAPALSGEDLEPIARIVGPEHLVADHDTRLAHTRGWSTTDLLLIRVGDAVDAPDAVVFPGDHDEVVAVLAECAAANIAVVPYSGGTSVVGGLTPERVGFRGVIALDLRRLDGMESIDPVSRVAVLQAGLRGPAAEKLLAEQGYTLGHFPQSYEGASIGGYAAARSAGQSSAGYGRFDEMVMGLRLATPRGTIELGTAPHSASGPDLRQLILGSEGTLGVITSVTVRIRPVPDVRVFEGWRFADFAAGAAAMRRLAQEAPLPTVVRLSDEVETQINLSDPVKMLGGGPGGCLAIMGYEGTQADVERRRAAAAEVLSAAGGTPEGTEPGEAWRAGRFRAPYLRDPLLDAGVLIETLETATFWSSLLKVRTAVTSALTEALGSNGSPVLVLCHISHVYETGASLYFTIACAQTDDAVGQWRAAKKRANAAIRRQGAATSHHHGVGRDHRETYAAEIGPLAADALRAVKQTLDPQGILNPGVLIPDEETG